MAVQFNTVSEILDYAIEREQEAAEFYHNLASQPLSDEVVQTFEEMEKTELKHKKTLEEVKRGSSKLKDESIRNLYIAEFAEDARVNENMTLVDALTAAMKKELQSYKLYIELAAAATNYETLDIFILLAQEEARHKLWLEHRYKAIIENLVLNN
jgi:rubrerythrin